jgi:hypothetical protein
MASQAFISYTEVVKLILQAAEQRLKLTDDHFGTIELLNAQALAQV